MRWKNPPPKEYENKKKKKRSKTPKTSAYNTEEKTEESRLKISHFLSPSFLRNAKTKTAFRRDVIYEEKTTKNRTSPSPEKIGNEIENTNKISHRKPSSGSWVEETKINETGYEKTIKYNPISKR